VTSDSEVEAVKLEGCPLCGSRNVDAVLDLPPCPPEEHVHMVCGNCTGEWIAPT
jgi:hypothetical protein